MTDTAAPAIELVNVTKQYGDAIALDGISLRIDSGEFFCLLGPSGCGKTTTLNLIGGFIPLTSGELRIEGRVVNDLAPHQRNVNTVFQNYALFPHMTVAENVAFGLRMEGLDKREIASRVDEYLELVGLGTYHDRYPTQMSGGQAQRVALARALAKRPAVLLLDEPLGALDLKLRKEMQLFIKGLQQEVGITFIHVTHDQEEAMTMADSIAVMSEGHIEQLGSPDDLYERPSTPFVARFLGASNLLEGVSNGDGSVRLDDGTVVRAPGAQGRQGPVAVGIRPEKIRIGRTDENALSGEVEERAYIGVSTQYIVSTPHGQISVYVQNSDAGAAAVHPGDQVTLSWSPDSTFVVDSEKERSE
jgi:spermidine/putrescine transport system ATP-binding protein